MEMEFTYQRINDVINKILVAVDDRLDNADIVLRAELEMFNFMAESLECEDSVGLSKDDTYIIPEHWEEHFVKYTDEYQKYLELKQKYENI